MILCAAGDTHGALDRLYEDVLAFEAALGVRFEWILHVGDFGVWPDPERIDRASRRHEGAGDFPAWYAAGRGPPRRTVFVKGNHEDFVWPDAQEDREILPDLIYLPNGATLDLGGVTVGGVGGCHGPSDYERRTRRLQGYA
ncbi:MAG: metallophosphoesterase, partial [Planctomycetota bacterium]